MTNKVISSARRRWYALGGIAAGLVTLTGCGNCFGGRCWY